MTNVANMVVNNFKFANRLELNALLSESQHDEVIIVKDGKITDSSYSNLVFYNGENWITPDTYLLNGVRRKHLLDQEKIREQPIRAEELERFEKACLINAMLDLGELEISMDCIYPL